MGQRPYFIREKTVFFEEIYLREEAVIPLLGVEEIAYI